MGLLTTTESFLLALNDSLADKSYYYEYDDPWGRTFPVQIFIILQCVLLGFLILGSVLLTCIVLAKRELRQNYTNWLALSAVIPVSILIVYCQVVYFKNTKSWMAGLAMCRFSTVASFTEAGAAPLTLLALSIDRCMHVWDPAKYPALRRPLVATLLIILPWVVATVAALAMVLGSIRPYVMTLGNDHAVCLYGGHYSHWHYFLFLAFPTLLLLIAMVTVVCRYCCFTRHLAEKADDGRNAMTCVVVLSVLFTLFTLPTAMPYPTYDHIAVQVFHHVTASLALFFLTIEPYLMMILLPDIRATIGQLCRSKTSDNEERTRLVKPM